MYVDLTKKNSFDKVLFSIQLSHPPFDAEVAEKFLNGIYWLLTLGQMCLV